MSHFGRFVIGRSRYLSCHSQRTFTTSKMNRNKYKTMKNIREKLMEILETDQIKDEERRNLLMKALPKSQSDLPFRTMKDSFDSAVVPLATDKELREKYTTFLGEVRLGRLMEDIDLFAVWCCVKHLLEPNAAFPHIIVTIRVDDIELINQNTVPKIFSGSSQGAFVKRTSDQNLDPTDVDLETRIDAQKDIRLSGHVCWVGSSSMEVLVWLDQESNGQWKPITRALLLMAARNANNTGPSIVNPLRADTPDEEKMIAMGQERKLKRSKMMKKSLLKTIPMEEELNLVHNLFIKTIDSKEVILDRRILPPNSKWMNDATLNNLVFCHPEHRNLHNKIFGGFLIRQALELSWTVSYLFAMKVPKLVHISDIVFYHPVDVGSLLKLYACVTYTSEKYIQVFVHAEAFKTTDLEGESTNGFNFTYKFDSPADSLYPQTYLEAMKYIDGRRHLLEVLNYVKN